MSNISHLLIPINCDCYLILGKDLEDVIKLRWKDHPGSSGWTVNAITVVLIREIQGDTHREELPQREAEVR